MSHRPTLRVVANNRAHDVARAAAERDYRVIAARVVRAGRFMLDCMLLPFRVVFAIWNFAVNVGFGFFRGVVRFFVALFGLGLVLAVLCGVGRVVFWPLFH